ncbi:MAG: ABC transporter ATP-binding protein [Actinobacteria bacterium]|nr:ABC transporter ATP-binding protein [Actinomycetota bacterium]
MDDLFSDRPAVLEANELYRFYHAGDDETLALKGVSMSVNAGELIAVTGPSGSGKSTLLACIAGLDEPDGGSVHIDGQMMSRRSESDRAELRARNIGMLFQNGNLLDQLTVEQNALAAQQLAGSPNVGAVRELLAEVGLESRADAYPATLSGGEAARAGLVTALANGALLILADEPTGELDETTGGQILALLRRRADAGAAVVIVTHSRAVAGIADREVSLRDGQVMP